MKRISFLLLLYLAAAIFLAASVPAQAEGGAIASIDEPAEAVGGAAAASVKPTAARKAPSKSKTARPAAVRPRAPVRTMPGKWDGFVLGDKYTFLNFEVISAEKPYHTRAAKSAGASGLVQVEILIDTTGRVLTARARTGNKLLHPEAERAALASRFNRPAVYGRPARAIGFLVYRFGAADAE